MQKSGIDAYALKLAAIIGMVAQHTAMVLMDVIPLPLQFPLHAAGGLTFPIMAFFLVEGYRKTSSLRKYASRLFIFALISQVPFMLAFGFYLEMPQLNIMFTLLFGLFTLILYDKMKVRWLFWTIFVIYTILSIFLNWAIIGPIMIIMYRTIKSEKARRIAPALAATGFNMLAAIPIVLLAILAPYMPEEIWEAMQLEIPATVGYSVAAAAFPIGMVASIFLLLRYNGQRGKSMRWLFYIAYPAHLLALALIAYVLGIGNMDIIDTFGIF